MRKLLVTIFTVLLVSSLAYSQVIIDEVDINQLEDVQYCELVGQGKFLSAKVTIRIDYGQKRKFLGKKDFFVKDKDGKKVIFYSMIEGLNFMYKNGWEYVDSYVVTESGGIGGKENVYHYLLKKRKQ